MAGDDSPCSQRNNHTPAAKDALSLAAFSMGWGIFSLRPDGIYGTLKMERTQVLSKKDKRKLRKRVFHASII